MCGYVYVCVCMGGYVRVCVSISVGMCMRVYVCMCGYMHVCVCVYVWVQVYMGARGLGCLWLCSYRSSEPSTVSAGDWTWVLYKVLSLTRWAISPTSPQSRLLNMSLSKNVMFSRKGTTQCWSCFHLPDERKECIENILSASISILLRKTNQQNPREHSWAHRAMFGGVTGSQL